MNNTYSTEYNPDVLTCLANLSSDEVFTPPHIVNQMLDMLPQELFKDKNTKFLDPATKSGVFLREIAKRLLDGLKDEIPDLQQRIDHIFQRQLYGIAVTEMTSLLSRRSVYCSKYPNSKYSITNFRNVEGNIIYRRVLHSWKNDRCIICGANKNEYDRPLHLENYAYEYIHSEIKELNNMKFDVIIGNPPYQLSDGGAQASAIPLYHKFVQQSKKLRPRYISMIIPSRWYAGGKGLDDFRKEMLNDTSLRKIHDFLDASDCFPNVEIKGGVCYFLWDRDNKGLCEISTHKGGSITSISTRPLLENGADVFIRYNEAIPILNKIRSFKEKSYSTIVSSRKPFGLATNFKDIRENKFENSYKIYANQKVGFVDRKYIFKGNEFLNKWKLFVPKAIGSGDSEKDWIKPIIGEPLSVCTETYIVHGPFDDKQLAENAISYIQTKFFHFLLTLKKITQDATSKVYEFIPLQDFREPWNDTKLFLKYKLTQEEINFINNLVVPSSSLSNDCEDE